MSVTDEEWEFVVDWVELNTEGRTLQWTYLSVQQSIKRFDCHAAHPVCSVHSAFRGDPCYSRSDPVEEPSGKT
jgi:hypothetical protein